MIDLAARLVAYESTYSCPGVEGEVTYHDGRQCTQIPIRYHLPDDWKFLHETLAWQATAEQRRAILAKREPLDVRAVVYGRALLEFIASACLASGPRDPALLGCDPHAPCSLNPPELSDAQREAERVEQDLVRSIHANWLLTARADLHGATPREMLLRHRASEQRESPRQHQQHAQHGGQVSGEREGATHRPILPARENAPPDSLKIWSG